MISQSELILVNVKTPSHQIKIATDWLQTGFTSFRLTKIWLVYIDTTFTPKPKPFGGLNYNKAVEYQLRTAPSGSSYDQGRGGGGVFY